MFNEIPFDIVELFAGLELGLDIILMSLFEIHVCFYVCRFSRRGNDGFRFCRFCAFVVC